jgi:arylsulfatase A-like enzyme
MREEVLLEAIPASKVVTASQLHQVPLRMGLILLSIVALFCLSAEAELIEQIDGMSLYMTYGEIAMDAGVALLFLVGMAFMWWLVVLLIVRISSHVRSMKHHAEVVWYLGLALPLSYLFLDLFGAVKAQIFPQWHSGFLVWLSAWLVCLAALFVLDLARLQEFCRTRLVPIAGAHLGLVVVAAIALMAKGVHPFHDYAHPGHAATGSHLPDIYLITMDALGAEDTSLYGYNRATTPHLDRFAQTSSEFDYFFANSNFTGASITSIETGKLPWSHRVFQQGGFLRDEAKGENLAALLRQRGYYTAMITSNRWAGSFRHRTLDSYDAVEYAAPVGIGGIWSRYTDLIGLNTQYTLYGALLKRLSRAVDFADAMIWPRLYPAPSDAVFSQARALLERHDIAQPRFLWTHILAPHAPYLPPAPYSGRFLSGAELTHASDYLSVRNYALPAGTSASELRARYDEMVLYADASVGDFLDWLDHTGRLDDAIVIVSADHGESFEHNWFLHAGPPLYNSLIQVPLLIHTPGQRHGVHISQPAEQADLLPTILDLVGASTPSWTDGVSLKPALEGETIPERLVFSMNLEPDRVFGSISKGTLAVMDGDFKYVIHLDNRQESLYRYKSDRLEEHNLITSQPEIAKRLHDLLLNRLEEVNAHSARRSRK